MQSHWIEPAPLGEAQRIGMGQAQQTPVPGQAPPTAPPALVQRQIVAETQRVAAASKHSTGTWVAVAVGAGVVLAVGYWLGTRKGVQRGKRVAKKEYRTARRAVEEFEEGEE